MKPFHTNFFLKSILDEEDDTFLESELKKMGKLKLKRVLSDSKRIGTKKREIFKNSEQKEAVNAFSALKLNAPMYKSAVLTCGFKEPTEIQKRVIPLVIEGKNIIASAETGTGKTAAYGLPVLQHLYRILKYEQQRKLYGRMDPIALILAPTKELSEQIMDHLQKMSHIMETEEEYGCIVRKTLIIGGVSKQAQIDTLKQGCDIVVGTPGRLLELLKLNKNGQFGLNFAHIRHLVLDECDKMLSMGFLPDLKALFEYLPKPISKAARKKALSKMLKEKQMDSKIEASNSIDTPSKPMQVLMFSATLTRGIEDLMYRFAPTHELVNLNESMQVASTVSHVQYHVGDFHKKYSLLLYLLLRKGSMKGKQVLVFVRTKQKAERLAKKLQEDHITSEAVYKSKSVSQRTKAIEKFRQGEIQVLISTDVLARGIDVENLPFVVNYDIPANPEDYVHRVGRTGRAGNSGMAISFVSHYPHIIKVGMQKVELNEIHFMKAIEKFISERVEHRKIPGPWKDDTLKIGPNGLPIIDSNDDHATKLLVESKKAGLKILEEKYERERRQAKAKQRMLSKSKKLIAKEEPDLSQTYLKLKQKLKQMSAKPTRYLADAVEEKDLPLDKIPSLRNFKEGRYEDVVASFDKKRAAKAGAVPKTKKKTRSSLKTKQRKHQTEMASSLNK
jgi:ATP-dependent RNA helicase RhlE